MFTGIIEECGTVQAVRRDCRSEKITISAETIPGSLKPGDSVAVNGICLTVTSCTEDGFSADVMPETTRRSALSQLKTGSRVNLERAMPVN